MKLKIPLLFSGVFTFLLFVLFSYLTKRNHFTTFDFAMTVKLQDHVFTHKFDTFFSWFSLIGSFEVVGIFLVILLFLRKKIKGGLVLILFGFMHLFEIYGKSFVPHPGPPPFFLRYNIHFLFPSSGVQPGSSYPSGHSARALFVTAILFLIIGKSTRLSLQKKLLLSSLVVLYDLIMVTSRVYLGEHWTSDVVGGSILGFSFGLLSLVFL